jgi:hypothetical protein
VWRARIEPRNDPVGISRLEIVAKQGARRRNDRTPRDLAEHDRQAQRHRTIVQWYEHDHRQQ